MGIGRGGKQGEERDHDRDHTNSHDDDKLEGAERVHHPKLHHGPSPVFLFPF